MAGLIGLLRGLFGGTGAAQTGQSGRDAELSADEARAAIAELSGGDAETLRVFDAALVGTLPEDSPFDAGDDQVTTGVAIMAALYATGRAVLLDWSAGMEEACAAFGQLFLQKGVAAGELPATIAFDGQMKRGDAVGLAYVTFRKIADAQASRILGINAGTDGYCFVLVPEAAAARWASVRIDAQCYFEDSDWQFKQQLRAAGLTPRSEKHPSRAPCPAPAAL
jgi:hypothetical protein